MRTARHMMAAVFLVALVTAVAWLIGPTRLAKTDIVLLYIAAITLVAVRFDRASAVVCALLSVAAFDVFFIHPILTFAVSDSRHLLTFAMMFGASVFVSALAGRLKDQEREARERERRTESVLALTRVTSAADSAADVMASLAVHAAQAFDRRACVLVPGAAGELVVAAASGGALDARERAHAKAAFDAKRSTLSASTPQASPVHADALPLVAQERYGVLVLAGECEADALDDGQRALAEAFVQQASASLERLRLAEEARVVALRRRTEEVRSALLSNVSHDLRTPLASITGAATTLLADGTALGEEDRRALLESIAEQGFQLERLVASLLDMNRVEAGALVLRREWVPLEEVVGSALARTKARLQPRDVETKLSSQLPLLHVDPVLFEQVLVNLLDNAAKHTPPQSRVSVEATADAGAVHIDVVDNGAGVPDGVDIFEKFVRGPGPRVPGLGLGLAICKSIVGAHGGSIEATRASDDAGARFAIALPMPMPPPPPPGAVEERL